MSVNYIAVDGLWRCLCPSIDSIAVSVATRQSARPSKRFPQAENHIRGTGYLQIRNYGGVSAKRKIVPKLSDASFSEGTLRNDGSEVTFGVLGKPAAVTGAHQIRGRDHIGSQQAPREYRESNPQLGHNPPKINDLQEDKRESNKSQLDTQYGGVMREGWLNFRPLFPGESVGMRKASNNQSFKALRDRIDSLEPQEKRNSGLLPKKGSIGLQQPLMVGVDGSRVGGNKSAGIKNRAISSSGAFDILEDDLAQNDGEIRAVLNKLFRQDAGMDAKEAQEGVNIDTIPGSLGLGPSKLPRRKKKSSQATSDPKTQPTLQEQQVFSKWIAPSPYLYDKKPLNLKFVKVSDSRENLSVQSVDSSRNRNGEKVDQNISRDQIEKWDSEELATLHDRLRECWATHGQYRQVVRLVEYLLVNRNEEPATIHFEALIRANTDAAYGSAECVRALLEELREIGVRADSGLYHAALQALAIHPDYDLRVEIMQEMKERWFGLSPEGWHSLVTGLLRERQIEIALEKLAQMRADNIEVQPWLYDIASYILCELEEYDEAFKLYLYRRKHSRLGIGNTHLQYLLDKFSSAFHYDATKTIWNVRVKFGALVPSDGTCAAVLDIAARNADPALATSVIQLLSARKTPLSVFHYEALVAAYTGSEDMRTAFRVLCIMEKTGLDPSSSNTRPLYTYLSTSHELCHEAWQILLELKGDGHHLPVTAVNVVLEALGTLLKVDEAYTYYKRLHEICPNGPNTETINTMLQGMQRRRSQKSRAMFLAREMQALKIRPNLLTYDRLIMICLDETDYEDAFRYLAEMEEVGRDSMENDRKGWWMRPGTAAKMVRTCASRADERAYEIMKKMEERGMPYLTQLRKFLERDWGKAVQNQENLESEDEL